MKKHLLIAASLAALLSSCTSEVIPERPSAESFMHPIEFSGEPGAMTRAGGNITGSAAANLLGKKFVVYGYKVLNSVNTPVFHNTAVSYKDNTGWDYTSDQEETRYWDVNATSYTFYAISDANSTSVVHVAETNVSVQDENNQSVSKKIINIVANPMITIGDNTSNVNLEQLKKVYLASPKTVTKANNQFVSPITFNFVNAAAKVRVAFYNAIPGYNVQIDNFYSVIDGTSTTKNVVLHGSFYETAAYSVSSDAKTTRIGTPTTTTIVNLGSDCTDKYIANTITDPTFDKVESTTKGLWTDVMPVNDAGADIKLKIAYRLISKHETISHTSTVTIPATFTKWEANHAYTYFFKITDNDMHPITFSAQVEDFTNKETITTVDAQQEADITTYTAASNVIYNDQYKVGDEIYVGVTNATSPTVEVAFTENEEVDGSNAEAENLTYNVDVNKIESGEFNGCYKFVASGDRGVGKYVIRVKYTDSNSQSKTAYKVVTVTNKN